MRKSGIIIIVLLLVAVLGLMLASTGILSLPFPSSNKISTSFSQNTFSNTPFSSRLDEESEHTAELKPKLKTETVHGSITVEGADVAEVQIVMQVQVKAATALRAQELLEGVSLQITSDTDKNSLRTVTPKPRNNETVQTDLHILIPIQTSLDLKTNLGDVSITNIQGKLSVQDNLGTIKVRNFKGNANLETDLGNVEISQSEFHQELTAVSHLGDLNIEASLAQKNVLQTDLGDLTLLLSPDQAYVLEGSISLGSISITIPFKGRQTKTHIQGVIGEGEQRGTILADLSLGSLKLKSHKNGRD